MEVNSNDMCRYLTAMKKMLPKYAPEIDQALGVMWCNALRDFKKDQILKAFDYATKNLTEWPAAAIIKNICLGVTKDATDIGQETCTAIIRCISSYGSWNFEAAKKDMGELAWEVVKACGGWNEICNITYEELPSSKKQWRELASSFAKGFMRDGFNRAHQIPAKSVVPDFLLD